MVILGIDPGLKTTGFSILDKSADELKLLDFGCFITDEKDSFYKRLDDILNDFNDIVSNYAVNCLAIEEIFFNKNVKTAIKVAQVRGAILYSAHKNNISIHEYNPLKIKLTITGDGSADKLQIQKMVQKILNLESIPKPDDAADAIAVAMTHGYLCKP